MQIDNTVNLGCRWGGGQIHIKQQHNYQKPILELYFQ